MTSSPHTPEQLSSPEEESGGTEYYVRNIRPDLDLPVAASVKLQNMFGITFETRKQVQQDDITSTMEETRGKKCLGEPLQFEAPPPAEWAKSMVGDKSKQAGQPMPDSLLQAKPGTTQPSHCSQPTSESIPQTPRQIDFSTHERNGIMKPLRHSPLMKRNLFIFERQLRKSNAGSLGPSRSSGSSSYSFASRLSGGTLRNSMTGQHQAPFAYQPVGHGTKRARVSKSQANPRKRVAKTNPFGRPGPIGYWIPDEGVQMQKPPREGSTATEGSAQGVGGNQLSEEIPDYGGCEIWFDDEGEVVEQRGKGWH